LIRLGYGEQLASAMVARRMRKPVAAGWAEFIKSCTRIT